MDRAAVGNLTLKRDRLARETKMVYDAANRLTETILPDTTPATDTDNLRQITKYDAAGQVEWQQDERGYRTSMKYDLAGRSIESKDALTCPRPFHSPKSSTEAIRNSKIHWNSDSNDPFHLNQR